MSFQQRLKCVKCPQHNQPIAYVCTAPDCAQQQHSACVRCVLDHQGHPNKLVYARDIELLLKYNATIGGKFENEVGLQALRDFEVLRGCIENKLQQMEDELRKLIISILNENKLSEIGDLLMGENSNFYIEQLEQVRQKLIDSCAIEKTKIDLNQDITRKKLNILQNDVQRNIQGVQKQLIDILEAYNTVFYTQEHIVRRLEKVSIDEDGQARPMPYSNTILRVNNFICEKESFLVGFHQPMLYKGCFNGTQYDSQKTPHTLIVKVHMGTDLNQSILEHHLIIEHQKMAIVDQHCYYVNFNHPLKLLQGQKYSISFGTQETKIFYTYQYNKPAQDEVLVFQKEDLNDAQIYEKSPYIRDLYSHHDFDQLPAVIVKYKMN